MVEEMGVVDLLDLPVRLRPPLDTILPNRKERHILKVEVRDGLAIYITRMV